MTSPLTRSESGSGSPLSARSSVDLPLPGGPSNSVKRPCSHWPDGQIANDHVHTVMRVVCGERAQATASNMTGLKQCCHTMTHRLQQATDPIEDGARLRAAELDQAQRSLLSEVDTSRSGYYINRL